MLINGEIIKGKPESNPEKWLQKPTRSGVIAVPMHKPEAIHGIHTCRTVHA